VSAGKSSEAVNEQAEGSVGGGVSRSAAARRYSGSKEISRDIVPQPPASPAAAADERCGVGVFLFLKCVCVCVCVCYVCVCVCARKTKLSPCAFAQDMTLHS
jgi:hypothetical protein